MPAAPAKPDAKAISRARVQAALSAYDGVETDEELEQAKTVIKRIKALPDAEIIKIIQQSGSEGGDEE